MEHPPLPPPYRYSCDDRSLLLSPLKTWVVQPLFRFVPGWLPANLITLLSACCVYLAFVLALVWKTPSPWLFAVIGLLIFAYTVGDHLDGMQAKTTQTGSALGEFLDHHSDVYNTSLLLFMLWHLFSIENTVLLVGILFGPQLAQATIYYEQYHTRHLQFESLSSLEGLFLIMAVCFACVYPPVYLWLKTPVVGVFSPILFLLLFSSVAAVVTACSCMWRLGRWHTPWIMYLGTHVCLAVVGAKFLSPWPLLVLMMLHNTNTIGRWMRGHLVDQKLRYPDLIAPVALCILTVLSIASWVVPSTHVVLSTTIILYLALDNIRHIVGVFRALQQYWFWVNPKPKGSA